MALYGHWLECKRRELVHESGNASSIRSSASTTPDAAATTLLQSRRAFRCEFGAAFCTRRAQEAAAQHCRALGGYSEHTSHRQVRVHASARKVYVHACANLDGRVQNRVRAQHCGQVLESFSNCAAIVSEAQAMLQESHRSGRTGTDGATGSGSATGVGTKTGKGKGVGTGTPAPVDTVMCACRTPNQGVVGYAHPHSSACAMRTHENMSSRTCRCNGVPMAMSIYTHPCVQACAHVLALVFEHVHAHVNVQAGLCTCIHKCLRTCACTCLCTYLCTCLCTGIYAHLRTCLNTYLDTCLYTCSTHMSIHRYNEFRCTDGSTAVCRDHEACTLAEEMRFAKGSHYRACKAQTTCRQYIVMAYTVMAYTGMACKARTTCRQYTVTAYIVMACNAWTTCRFALLSPIMISKLPETNGHKSLPQVPFAGRSFVLAWHDL